MKDDRPRIIKTFIYGGRRCFIVLIDRRAYLKKMSESKMSESLKKHFQPYHNGYIQLKKGEKKKLGKNYMDYNIRSEELTYEGDLHHINAKDGNLYIGFDTAHYYNDEHPETKTSENVEETCKKIVKELNKKLKVKK